MLYGGIAGGTLLVALFLIALFSPEKGSVRYGVCKTFIELQLAYPTSLDVRIVEDSARSVRIYYVRTDPYGQKILDMAECSFKQDPLRGLQLENILVNRTPVGLETVKRFNNGIEAAIQARPDLTLPPRMSRDIRKLRR